MKAWLLMVASLILVQCYVSDQVNAQIPKSLQKTLDKVEKKVAQNQIEDAVSLLKKAQSKYPDSDVVDEQLSFAYATQEKWTQARESMQNAITKQSKSHPKRYLFVANYCLKIADYPCELDYLNQYLPTVKSPELKEKIEQRIQLGKQRIDIIQHSTPVDIELLPPSINQANGIQYLSAQTVDGQNMIFTRRVDGQEDFFISHRNNGDWQEAYPIKELNTLYNEGAHTINADGSLLIFTRCDGAGPHSSCDLYLTYKKGKQYSTPAPLGLVNTDSWESQPNISSDGNTLLFVSNRKGGQGGRDIYMIKRENGQWSEIHNLGPIINTKGDEEAPFLHPDGKTLYFMSDGHPGLGGKDLFYTKQDDQGQWQTPVNLGASINTSDNEGALSIDVFGEYAYFSRGNKIDGNLQSYIYRFPLPEAFKPDPVSYVKFAIKDAETDEPLDAFLNIVDEQGQTKIINITKAGIIYTLPANQSYQIYIDRPDYIYFSEKIVSNKNSKTEPLEKIIYLQPISEKLVESKPIVLQNVQFESNQSILLPSSQYELDKLVKLLQDYPSYSVKIIGHTDNIGNDQDNMSLSQRRADAVKSYLMEHNIAEQRITTIGKGENEPIADNETEVGRSINRRTEFVIIR